LVTLLAAGTLVVLVGVISLLATVVPLWAALLITGALIFAMAGIIAYELFSEKIVLQTPTAGEMVNRGKT
jgi:membrane glycosyltransferase